MLTNWDNFKSVNDIKVLGSTECVSQHKLLLGILNYIRYSANHVTDHQNKNLGSPFTVWKLFSWKCTFFSVSTEFWQSLEGNQNWPAWCKPLQLMSKGLRFKLLKERFYKLTHMKASTMERTSLDLSLSKFFSIGLFHDI